MKTLLDIISSDAQYASFLVVVTTLCMLTMFYWLCSIHTGNIVLLLYILESHDTTGTYYTV